MDRFVSNFTLRLDSKGRVSILVLTARFSAATASRDFIATRRWIVPRSTPGSALMAEIEVLIGRYAPFSDQREQFALALYGTSETLKIDGEGRVVLSENLKRHAGIIETVAFVGLGHEVSDLGARPFPKRARGGHPKVRALKGELSSRSAARDAPGARG